MLLANLTEWHRLRAAAESFSFSASLMASFSFVKSTGFFVFFFRFFRLRQTTPHLGGS
jgi:hypothetical protein